MILSFDIMVCLKIFRPNPLEDFGSELRWEDSSEAVELVENLVGRNLDLGFLQFGIQDQPELVLEFQPRTGFQPMRQVFEEVSTRAREVSINSSCHELLT